MIFRAVKHFSSIVLVALLATACQIDTALRPQNGADVGRPAINEPLKPFKDARFSYRAPLESQDGGDFLKVPYDEAKDIDERDEIPVRKVRSGWVRPIAKSAIVDTSYPAPSGPKPVYSLARTNGATMTVIYIHGRGGTREWGFDDERFGGNFNRLKNLLLENDGAYHSPDFSDFGETGAADIAALIANLNNPGRLVIACGSLGTAICWRLASHPTASRRIGGMVVLGGFPDSAFQANARLPLYIAHGSRDSVYPVADMKRFYSALRSAGRPVRMTVFESGNHGTPVRMIDWRQALNWIAQQQSG